MARVFIPAQWRDLSDSVAEVELPGANMHEIVAALDGRFPGIKGRLCVDGELAAGIAVSIDGAIASRGLRSPVCARQRNPLPACHRRRLRSTPTLRPNSRPPATKTPWAIRGTQPAEVQMMRSKPNSTILWALTAVLVLASGAGRRDRRLHPGGNDQGPHSRHLAGGGQGGQSRQGRRATAWRMSSTNVSATPDTVYKIGSVSKQFLATGIMLLVQDGKLKVNDPIGSYLEGTTRPGRTSRSALAHAHVGAYKAPGFGTQDSRRRRADQDAYPQKLGFAVKNGGLATWATLSGGGYP